MKRQLRHFTDWLRRLSRERRLKGLAFPDPQSVQTALRSLDDSSSAFEYDDREQPIFVLAVGWRTGSTLLQRVLMTDPSVLIWGEPFGRMAFIPRMVRMVCAVENGWPPADYWIDGAPDPQAWSSSWVANLFPPASAFRAALRAALDRWLAGPAGLRGFSRWGMKEVRLGASEAVVLRWLYPGARFIVLIRDPYDAYLSARGAGANWRLGYQWPDYVIDTPGAFAHHWNRLAMSWTSLAGDFPRTVVRYEDVISEGFDFEGLGRDLHLQLRPQAALRAVVGSSRRGDRLSGYERFVIRREARAGMKAFGYCD
jgi:hypothetical protein